MSKKNKFSNIVYSTNPDFNYEDEEEDTNMTLPPEKQNLVIRLDKKQRKGKQVTLVSGFVGSEENLKELGRTLKSKCGVGGTAKNGEILVQGDHRRKVKDILENLDYRCKLSG